MYKKIDEIEFELTTFCNSSCFLCTRFSPIGNSLYFNPLLNINKHLDFKIIESVLKSDYISPYASINLIGTAGEPTLYNHLFDVIDLVAKHKPRAFISIHTNGDTNSPSWFGELAKKLSPLKYRVKFSIDGLEDTNHIYRIGVNYHKVLENLKAFIANGGLATWQMVHFPWNEHQIEDCKKLAKEYNCQEFVLRDNVADDYHEHKFAAENKIINKQYPELSRQHLKEAQDNFLRKLDQKTEISPKCVDDNYIFVDINGRVLPCCMMYSALIDDEQTNIAKEFLYSTDSDWNDIAKYGFDKIIDNTWWSEELETSINETPNPICVYNCGHCDKEKTMFDLNEKKYPFLDMSHLLKKVFKIFSR